MISCVFAEAKDPKAIRRNNPLAKSVSCTECARLIERIMHLERKIELIFYKRTTKMTYFFSSSKRWDPSSFRPITLIDVDSKILTVLVTMDRESIATCNTHSCMPE